MKTLRVRNGRGEGTGCKGGGEEREREAEEEEIGEQGREVGWRRKGRMMMMMMRRRRRRERERRGREDARREEQAVFKGGRVYNRFCLRGRGIQSTGTCNLQISSHAEHNNLNKDGRIPWEVW